jgi:hypothetical protein
MCSLITWWEPPPIVVMDVLPLPFKDTKKKNLSITCLMAPKSKYQEGFSIVLEVVFKLGFIITS